MNLVLVVGRKPYGPTVERKSTMSKIGRNAGTGLFTPVKTAQQKPATHVVETIRRLAPAPTPKPVARKK